VGNTVTGGELIGYRTSRPPEHTLDRDCRSVSDYQTKTPRKRKAGLRRGSHDGRGIELYGPGYLSRITQIN
jgi:hypothetical protein